jgi:hypothetical protein
MAIPGATVLLSAFLLFQVQLLLGKAVLPWFGGVPAVWTTCMLFFQVVLLGGYAYAHWLIERRPVRAQRRLHGALLAASLALLLGLALAWGNPVLPGAGWRPVGSEAPIGHIAGLLAVAVGLPFFTLSATGPLVQAWFAVAHPASSPYRLYALSNAGSLLGLVTYPFAVEIWLPLPAQAWLWTGGFVLFAIGMAACAPVPAPLDTAVRPAAGPGGPAGAGSAPSLDAPPTAGRRALWAALAGCASVLLLATTNQMSQDVAVVPFLWMLPLALYLVSFILCFDSDRWYGRGVWGTLLALGLVLNAVVVERGVEARLWLQVAVPSLALLAACMICHGELVRLKPPARHLTSFYLTITAGGAAGGVFVGMIAPAIFPGLWEYPLALWSVAALLCSTLWRDRAASPRWALAACAAAAVAAAYLERDWLGAWMPALSDRWLFGAPTGAALASLAACGWTRWRNRLTRAGVGPPGARRGAPGDHAAPWWRLRRIAAMAAGVGALLLLAVALVGLTQRTLTDVVHQSRSFYGVLQVIEEARDDVESHLVKLRHGRIVHGVQYRAEDRRREPTSYYGRDSGLGMAIEHHPRRAEGLRIGVIGLGTGSIAVYGRAPDTLRFYEINPAVVAIAGPRGGATFSYLRDTPASVEVVLGDARIALERELARGAAQRFDVLAVDAFSSDAIPMHLLTREAVAVYLAHLDAGGVLAVHISNRYLGLEPVVRGLARHFGLAHVFVSSPESGLAWSCDWALLARDPRVLAAEAFTSVAAVDEPDAPALLWTDAYSNLFRVLKL